MGRRQPPTAAQWVAVALSVVMLATSAAIFAHIADEPASAAAPAAPAVSTLDHQAAVACHDFAIFTTQTGEVTGDKLGKDAAPLLAGSADAATRGAAEPRYAQLGARIVATAADAARLDSAGVSRDGTIVVGECNKVPSAARRAVTGR